MFSELLVLQTARPAHGLHHFLVKFHGRWKHLRVMTKDVAKIDMNQMPRVGEQKVIQVPIPHTKKISDHTVTGCHNYICCQRREVRKEVRELTTTLDIRVHHLGLNTIRCTVIRGTLPEKSLQINSSKYYQHMHVMGGIEQCGAVGESWAPHTRGQWSETFSATFPSFCSLSLFTSGFHNNH